MKRERQTPPPPFPTRGQMEGGGIVAFEPGAISDGSADHIRMLMEFLSKSRQLQRSNSEERKGLDRLHLKVLP